MDHLELYSIPQNDQSIQLTGVQLGEMAATDSKVMVSYADNGKGNEWSDSNFNIYVKVLPLDAKCKRSTSRIDLTDLKTLKLTNFSDNSPITAQCPKMITLSNGDVVVMWEEWNYTESEYNYSGSIPMYRLQHLERSLGTNKVAYVILDQDGNVKQEKQTIDAALSDCKPIEADSKLVWYVTHNSEPTFYTLSPYKDTVEKDGCEESEWSTPITGDTFYRIPFEYYEPGDISKMSDYIDKKSNPSGGGSKPSDPEKPTPDNSEDKPTQEPVRPGIIDIKKTTQNVNTPGNTYVVPETPKSGTTADNTVEVRGVTYRIQGIEAVVTGYAGNATSVVVYDSIQKGAYTYPVTAIADNVFSNASTVKTLYIPVTLSSIGSIPSTVKVYLNADTMISKVSGKRKSMQLKWAKRTGIDGYQIQYGTSKKFKPAKKVSVKVKTKNPTSKTIKKLKSGKKYYARIRLYKTISGRKYYSAWSGKRTVKIK